MKGAREGAWLKDKEFAAKRIALLRHWIADSGQPKLFSPSCRAELSRLKLTRDDIALIEATCEIGEFQDSVQHRCMQTRVSALLRQRGIRLPKGKRTRPDIEAFVKEVCGTLRDIGVHIRTGEDSRAVVILRRIAEDLELPCDPRVVLRRLRRLDRESSERTKALVFGALARGLRADDP